MAEPIIATLLRRLDWRYLVPTPEDLVFEKMVLLGADEPLVEAARASGMASQVETSLAGGDDVRPDLVAVLSTSTTSPEDALACLRPGGVLYVETDRRHKATRMRTPHRLALRLQGAGATIVGQYALRPDPERCEVFVPIDDSAALRWFISSVYVASTPAKVAAEIGVRRLLAGNGRRLGSVVPCHGTVAVVPPPTGAVLSSRIVGAPSITPPPTATITHGRNRVVQLVFSDPDRPAPTVVVKIPKQRGFADRTRHEHAIAGAVRARLPDVDAASIPAPRQLVDVGWMPVAVEDAAPGCSLARSCGRWGRPLPGKIDDLQLATSWLIRLHLDNAIRPGVFDARRQAEVIDAPLAAFAARFDVTAEEAALFDATRAAAESLAGAPLPVVWEHGDYTIWNLFRDGDRIRVLDWESCREGVPLADMIRLATHWHEAVRRAETPASKNAVFAELFCPAPAGSPATNAARRAIDRYELALGLDPRFRAVLLVISRVEIAVRRNQQQRDDGTATADVREGNATLRYLARLAGLRTALFPEYRPADQV